MAAFSSSPFQQLMDSSPPLFMAANSHHHHLHHPQANDTNTGGFYESTEALENQGPVFSQKNMSMDNSSSIVTDKNYHESSEQITAQKTSMDKKRKSSNHATNSPNSAQSKDLRAHVKGKKQRRMKEGEENKKSSKEVENKGGYIHVRARRGQATDSHSLAERVRRERISERMKLLQALVPGCDKVTGKALMLDEIINYVQSLQNQVEFLSMKLASVNPMFYDFGMDLEALMVRPDQNLSSPLAGLQQCSPTTPVLDNSDNSLMFQQPQIPNAFPQGHRQMFWEVEEQRQKIDNQAGMISNTLFSFH